MLDDIVLLDTGTAGLMARMVDDGPGHLATECLAHPDTVHLSTELVAWLLHWDARDVRTLIADGTLPAGGRTKKFVSLAALSRLIGREITHGELVRMFERAAWRRPPSYLAKADEAVDVSPPVGRRALATALGQAGQAIADRIGRQP